MFTPDLQCVLWDQGLRTDVEWKWCAARKPPLMPRPPQVVESEEVPASETDGVG